MEDIKNKALPSYKIHIVLLCAGSSKRMGCGVKKEYLPLKDGTVLSSALLPFLSINNLYSVVVVTPYSKIFQDFEYKTAREALFSSNIVSTFFNKSSTKLFFTHGGEERQESVYLSLSYLNDNVILKTKKSPLDIVLIHDAARPYVTTPLIQDVIDNVLLFGAAAPGIIPTDTQKIIDTSGIVSTHLERKRIRAVQTPQGFLFNLIFEAHKKAREESFFSTDDTAIYDKYTIGAKGVKIVEGEVNNKKITYKEDYESGKAFSSFRSFIGLGYDLHKLVPSRPLILGGIIIPYEKGEEAHSDGDVLIHAIIDSLLGAAHLGDIGTLFPDTDPQYKDISSIKLLKIVKKMVEEKGYSIGNIDAVIKLENPKLFPFREKIVENIAHVLNISSEKVFIKAKTGEGLGEVGRGNAIEVFTTCLLIKVIE